MPFVTQSINTCWSKAKQTDVVTANDSTDMIRLSKINPQLMNVQKNTETDANWLGRGTEFATNVFKVSGDVNGSIEKFFSPEFAAWSLAFCLGKSSFASGTYTITPLQLSDGINVPTFSYCEQISGSTPPLDRLAVGCALEQVSLSIKSGPGLASAQMKADFVGSGITVEPSGITMPALNSTVETPLYAATAAVSILGVDYVGSHDIISLDWMFKNNIRLNTGFYPGSGTSGGFATRARMEYGTRACSLSYVARFESDANELVKIGDVSTEGSVTFSLTGSGTESFSFTFPHAIISQATVSDAEGIITVNVSVTPIMDATTLVLGTATVKTGLLGIAV